MKKMLLILALIVLSVPQITAQNLLTNGDFESGGPGTGFAVGGAGYTQLTPPFLGTTLPGNYAVTGNPQPMNTVNFLNVPDHTNGTGNMLVVDGLGTNAGQPRFWESGNAPGGTICGLTIGHVYSFSYWIRSVSSTVTNPATQADIRFAATNATGITLVSGNALAPLPAFGWQKVTYRFTASAACVNLGLWNNNISAVGNDFAIDDVALVPDNAEITGSTTVCQNGPAPSVTFTANVAGTPPYTFTYNINGTGSYTATTTAASNTTSVALLSTATPGTFNYNLVSVAYGATVIPQTGTATITVTALPTASIFGNTTILPGGSATLTFYGTPGATVSFTSTLGSNSVVIGADGVGTYNIPYIATTTTFNLVSITSAPAPGVPSCTKSLVGLGSATVTVNAATCALPLVEVSIDAPSPVCNLGECTELLAHFSNIGSTTDYIVSPIPYCPSFPFTGGTPINATGDDTWSPLVNLPFNFSFYGTCYNQVLVGTNGVITFDLVNQTPLGGCAWAYTATVPNPAFPIRNAIYGVYQDTDISNGAISDDVIPNAIQNVNYYVLDTGPNAAPNRVFVANFNELPQFQCHAASGVQTSQIVIHETTNIIEVFVNKRTPCLSWNSGSGLIGVQNQAGSLATVPPGRNTGTWNTTNEAWRFYPKNIPAIPTEIRWLEGGSLIPGSINQNPLTVCPTGPTTYTAVVKYTNCGVSEVSESITLDVAAPLPVGDPDNIVICSSAAPPYTVDIDQTADMFNELPTPFPGNYTIKYYEDLVDAENDDITNIPPGSLSTFTFSGPLPKTIYVRIEDLVTTGCYNIRPFTIDIGSPSGTISYPATPYCHNLTTQQPITETALTSGGTYSAVPVPASANVLTIDPATGAITPNTSNVGTYTVTYSIPAAPPCPVYNTSTTVDIIDCGCTVVASSASETLCINTALTPITYTAVNAVSGVISAGALPVGVSGSFSGGVYTVSGTPSVAGTYNYTVKITDNAGLECQATTTIVVNPNATVVLTSAPGNAAQTVCINTTPSTIVYTIGNGATGASVSGLPAGMSGALSGNTFTISGVPTASGPFSYTVTTSGGCSTDTETGTITVNPIATIALTSPLATTSQTVCINTNITNIVYAIANGGTGATALSLPPGVTGTFAGGNFTISGAPTTAGTYNYTVTTTGGCPSSSLTGTIVVDPDVTIALTSAPTTNNQTVCINTPITNIEYTTANGATGVTPTNLPAGVTGTFVGGIYTLSGTPTVTGTFNYSLTTVGGCASDTETGTIIINPDATIALTSPIATAAQTVCINTPIVNITYTIADGATGANTTGLPAGVTGTLTGTTYTISGTPTVAGPFSYTVTTTGGCSSDSETGTINVNPDSTIALTSAANTDNQTACLNTPITNIEYTVASGATGASASGLPTGITGTFAGGIFTISGSSAIAGTYPYTVTTSGGCAAATASGTIIISPDVTIALTSAANTASQVVCISSPIVNIQYTTANGATGATFAGLPTGVTGSFLAGVVTISGTPTIDGLFGYTVTTVGGCGTASDSGTIMVNPAATIALTSAAGTDAQTLCINTAITPIEYTVATGATGATVLGLPTGVTGTFAGNEMTITGTPTTAGTFNYTVTTTGGCSSASLTGTITVDPDVTIALTSAPTTNNQTVCINTPITNIEYTTANGATGVTPTNLPAGVTGTFVGGIYTLSGTPTVTGTFNYSLTTVGGCASDTETGTIIINPDATIALTSPIATAAQTVCINTPIVNITYTIADGATGANTTGLPAGVTGTLTGTTYTISGTPTVAGPFSYTVTTTGGCSSDSETGTINVNPDSTIALTSAANTDNQTACLNTPITNIEYTVASGATGASASGLPTGITGTFAGGIFTISGSSAIAGTYPYTVTTSGGCAAATASGTIIISPDVTIALTSAANTDNQTLCINTAITNIQYTLTNGATGATPTGLPAGVTGSFVAGVYTLSGSPSVAGTFNYTIATAGGCGADSINGTITVNPNATIALTSGSTAQDVCINTAIGAIVYTVGNGATNASATGLPTGVTGTFAGGVFTISGTPSAAGTFAYTVTTSGGCSTASLTGTIIVRPNVTLVLNSAASTTGQTVCVSTGITPITYLVANAGPLGATVSGLPAGVTSSYNAATGIFTISGTPTVAGNYNYIVTTSGGCSSASANGSILVNPNATLTLTSAPATTNQTHCIAATITPVVFTIGNGATGAAITAGALPAGITGTFSGSTFTISGASSTAGTFNYAVTTTGGCSSQTITGVIVIRPNVTLQLTSATSTSNQSLCQNTAIDTITYVTGNFATGVNVTGLPPGIVWNYAAATGVLTISGSGTAQGTFNYSIVTVGGCSSATLGGTIKLLPNATIALSSAVGTDAQTVCISQEAITDIKYLVGNGATGASIVAGNVPTGISGSFDLATLTFTITGTPTESGVFPYTVKTSGGCSSATIQGTITVLALPVIGLLQDAFICIDPAGTPITTATLTTALTTATHTFVWSDASGVIASATGSSYVATTPGVYSVKATNIATGCYNSETTTVASSFAPQTVTAVIPSYFADDQAVTILVSPPGNYLYQVDGGAWQESNQFINLPAGYHTVTVKDKVGCGELPTTFRLIDYPKFFTPNNDGYNDFWNIKDLSDQPTSLIEIFDRYGKLLKEISPTSPGWDGTLNGYPLPSTDYWFKVYYMEDTVSKTFKSHFSLKR